MRTTRAGWITAWTCAALGMAFWVTSGRATRTEGAPARFAVDDGPAAGAAKGQDGPASPGGESPGKDASKRSTVKVEGFTLDYEPIPVTAEDEGEKVILRARAKIEARRALSYRRKELPAGRHDLWFEGEEGKTYLMIGKKPSSGESRGNQEATGEGQDGSEESKTAHLRIPLRIREVSTPTENLTFGVRTVRRATRLELSVQAGRSTARVTFAWEVPEDPAEDRSE